MKRPSSFLRSPVLAAILLASHALGSSLAHAQSSPQEFDAAFSALRNNTTQPDTQKLHELFKLHWRYAMQESPEAATYNGYPVGQDRWTDLSRPAIARRRAELSRTLQTLDAIRRASLSPQDTLYYDLFRRNLAFEQAGAAFPFELISVSPVAGPQRDIADTLGMMPARSPQDLENYLSRLQSLPRLLDQYVDLLREGARRDITPPRVTLRDVPQQVLNLIPTDPALSPLLKPLQSIAPSVSPTDAQRARARALDLLQSTVYPAWKRFHEFLVQEYLPGARTTLGWSQVPNGPEWYRHFTRHFTTTDLTPDQIHDIGLQEVRRIRAEMDVVIRETSFRGTFSQFTEFLRTNQTFYYTRGQELIAGYREITLRSQAGLPKLFGRLPKTPIEVQPIPSYSERSQTTAYYQPGSLQAGRPGIYFANTYALPMRPKWEMEALSLHEAVPGHHLQIALAQELTGVPDFQRHSESTAFVEGWALYSESLGPVLGFYKDPYSKFGQLTYEIWRAIRLVVDTGIHSKGWSREQAIQYFRDNSGKTDHDIVVEVDRYIAWPGQALAYKIGELKIKELRALAEKELGPKFDVREFHDELLSRGALPLSILDPLMRRWIDAKK